MSDGYDGCMDYDSSINDDCRLQVVMISICMIDSIVVMVVGVVVMGGSECWRVDTPPSLG